MKTANKITNEGVYSPTIFVSQQTTNKYTISITDNISDTFIYDEVLMVLENAEENDEVVFNIASYGGQLNSLLSIRSAILSTKATVTGKLVSHACSAAGMLLLSCHNKIVYPNTMFHAHTASYGSYGKSGDVKAQVDFETKQIEDLVYDIYGDGFLLESEIIDLLNGKELYFNDVDTMERLERQSKTKIEKALGEVNKPLDLSEYTDEELESELTLYKEDVKMIQNELKKRKK